MRRAQHSLWTLAMAFACLGLAAGAATAAPRQVATLSGGAAGVDFRPVVEYEKLVLTVSGPGGMSFRHEFAQGQAVTFSAFGKGGQALPDGNYTYELLAVPRFSPEVRQRLAAARAQGNERAVLGELRQAGKLPNGTVQSGGFLMESGTFIVAGLAEETGPKAAKEALRAVTAADQVIPDDLIVQGSLCVGFDCVNNENFGFDTIRLKENNLRIKFEDTSVGSFPTNDWQLTANDSASGGASKFSIEDITGAKVPFTIRAGAATNSIFVDSIGRVGFRTSTPVLDIHINTSNTPAIRLEQNSSGGFTAQTWDIAGNEANFFVRDVTGGSRLPFRIRPNAPTSSVDISADGDVGIGTASPDASLHVLRSNGSTLLHVEEESLTTAARTLLTLENQGNTSFTLTDTNPAGSIWQLGNLSDSGVDGFVISRQGDGENEFIIKDNGDVFIENGTVQVTSSRDVKENFETLDPKAVLASVSKLPITAWTYKKDDGAVRHIGPMAEEFYAAFRLGSDDKHVSHGDTSGVALAAVQGLHQELLARDARIEELERQIQELRALLTAKP
ncbi:MAG TPA: tail fiber domain-containing protein [Thermoanaerobaculia bacterium]